MAIQPRRAVILGAGASRGTHYANYLNPSPLDRDFVALASEYRHGVALHLFKFIEDTASLDGELSSMESVFSRIDVENFVWNKLLRLAGRPHDYKKYESSFYKTLLRLLRSAHGSGVCKFHSNVFRKLDLGPGDFLVTFNYDVVAERALVKSERSWSPSTAHYALDGPVSPSAVAKRLMVYKLHGSINWSGYTKIRVIPGMADRSIYKPLSPTAQQVLLPGYNKRIENGVWKRLWKAAGSSLRKATEWYVIGYSLNPTDIKATILFENAMKEARKLTRLVIVDPSDGVRRKWVEMLRGVQHRPSVRFYNSLEDFSESLRLPKSTTALELI